MNFRQLVDLKRREGLKADEPPRTMHWVAEATGVSRPQIYNLINGSQVASAWTVAKIAKGFRTRAARVEAALEQSRAEALTS